MNIKYLKNNILCDMISKKKNGNIIFRQGFFYRHNKNAEHFAENIKRQLRNLNIKYKLIENGEHYKAFRGGASLVNQSHWYVIVNIEEGRI